MITKMDKTDDNDKGLCWLVPSTPLSQANVVMRLSQGDATQKAMAHGREAARMG